MESDLVKKLLYKQERIYGTDLHILEFSPFDFEMVVTEGNPDKKEPLSEIRHNWYEERGYKRAAAINMQFFWIASLGLQYLDKGFLKNSGDINDQFLELIYENKELKIDNIIGSDIKNKYPSAEWAAGVGFQLIKDGKINTRYGEKFDHYNYRHPRTAIGQKKDGSIIWLVTDGRTGEDRGLTGQQLAQIMLDLGCVTAISFDGGGSSEMVIAEDETADIEIINELRFGYERPIGSALLLYAKNWKVEKGENEMKVDLSVEGRYTAVIGHMKDHISYEGNKLNCKNPWENGKIVGVMGTTGFSTGEHVHLGVFKGVWNEIPRLSDPDTKKYSSKEQLDWFIKDGRGGLDKELLGGEMKITTDYNCLDYKAKYGWPHWGYDLARKDGTKNPNIYWNRSFASRVIKTGHDKFYGNYALIMYDTLTDL